MTRIGLFTCHCTLAPLIDLRICIHVCIRSFCIMACVNSHQKLPSHSLAFLRETLEQLVLLKVTDLPATNACMASSRV